MKITENYVIRDMTSEEEAHYTKIQSDYAANASNRKLAQIRSIRNKKLSETDYLAMSDNVLSDDMKNFRKTMRDIPQDFDESKLLAELTSSQGLKSSDEEEEEAPAEEAAPAEAPAEEAAPAEEPAPAEASASAVKEVVEQAVDNATSETVNIPASAPAEEPTVFEKYSKAFAMDQFDFSK